MPKRLLPPNISRYWYDLSSAGFPEIPLIGVHNLLRTEEGLREHIHDGAMEICYLQSGRRTYHVQGRDYTMQGNDVFVTFPDESHGSGRRPHERGLLYWMQVILPKRPRQFLGLSARQGWLLAENLRSLPRRFFRGRREMQTLFEGVFRYPQPDLSASEALTAAMRIQLFLTTVVECSHAGAEPTITEDIQQAMDFTAANLEGEMSLDALAAAAGLSLSRFKAKFRRQVGLSPWEYVLREKIQRAETLLRETDDSITAIAMRLGFSSSQYFATVFKRYTQKRPGDMR
ncbi:MAG: AraC family transcriptional regulator [Phycisphaerae bacterium]|nr:AraC family transcriptional regulator [Phycisphaerae bacterium]